MPPELVDKFTQGEHAALTVVCGEIQRCGLCAWCLAKIAAIKSNRETASDDDKDRFFNRGRYARA